MPVEEELDSPKNALVLCIYSTDNKLLDQRYWKPGMQNPYVRVIGLHGERVQVVAHGTALDWVYNNFEGIRKTSSRDGGRWVGDDALFIMNNISTVQRYGDKQKVDTP